MDQDFSYKEISEMSEVTEEAYPDSMVDHNDADIQDYHRLVEQTKKKVQVLENDETASVSVKSLPGKKEIQADEFLRNFFIKFGMKRTLESF